MTGIGIWKGASKNTEPYKAELCINQIYDDLSSFLHAAISSKILIADSDPEKYQIEIENSAENPILKTQINLKYNDNDYKTLDISQRQNCLKTGNYHITMTPTFKTSELLPSLRSQGNIPSFTLKGENFERNLTGTIYFRFCEEENNIVNHCKDFAKFNLDTRTGLLNKTFCQLYNTDDPNTTNKDE